jgi:hypothetical protein
MLIPAQRPDVVEPPALRREALPASAALPVSGLPEQAQVANPRLTVQAVQPGFQGEAATGLRPAPGLAAAPLPNALQAAGDPSAMLQLSDSGHALTQWLGQALARRPLGQPLPWPAPDAQALTQAAAIAPPGPMRTLWTAYLALARSEVFATSHLFHQFWPQNRPPPGQGAAAAESLKRWVEALAPEAEPALDGASMLLGGAMAWQGELVPGWPLTLRREDAWRPDEASRSLQKGVALRLELQVPERGPLRVYATQWGQHELDIQLSWPPELDWPAAHWQALRERLASMGLPGLRLGQRAWLADDAPAARAAP